MKTRKPAFYYQKTGALEAYIEILTKGIREICIPNYGESKKENLSYIDEEARKHGLCTALIKYDRVAKDGRKFKSYQRIIFLKSRKADACLLKSKIQVNTKGKDDHEVIGRLLGYSKEAIDLFVRSCGASQRARTEKGGRYGVKA